MLHWQFHKINEQSFMIDKYLASYPLCQLQVDTHKLNKLNFVIGEYIKFYELCQIFVPFALVIWIN